MGDFSIFSMNCRGLRDIKKRRDVLNYIREKKHSIYCLQDTHFTDNEREIIRCMWGFDVFLSCGTSNSRGVCTLIKNNFEYEMTYEYHDNAGNLSIISLLVDKKFNITLVNIYGPNNDDPIFYTDVENVIQNVNTDFIIMCGDWNLIQNFDLDCHSYTNLNNPNARQKVLNIMSGLNLIDPWRVSNPTVKAYTWKRSNPTKKARLDFFLISEELSNLVESTSIGPGYRTDHSCISIALRLTNFKRGPGLWRFNNSLLKDAKFVERIKTCIREMKCEYAIPVYNFDNIDCVSHDDLQFIINDSLFFETLLLKIRSETIYFSKCKKRERANRIESLERQIIVLHEICQAHRSEHFEQMLDELNIELEGLRKYIMRGQLIRTRARWIEEGEKPTKYFANLEKRNFVNKNITKLTTDDNRHITDQSELLKCAFEFYKSLYENKDDPIGVLNLDDLIHSSDVAKIRKSDHSILEGCISVEEASLVVKNMKDNKTPGPDGFTTEFYKFFWRDIATFMIRSFNYSFKIGSLPVSQHQGAITIIPKPGKPREYLKNWRPISLLNISYKILSSCIAKRLKMLISDLIHENQKGFLKQRFIGENTRLIYDLLVYTENCDIPGLLVLVDFEKAFDSLSWRFLYKTLKFFEFSDHFISWIKLLNQGAALCVIQHNFTSEYFEIGRGCRQGDPISPYLFLLCAEILAILFRQNKEIKGIKIGRNDMFKISQYADDTILMLDGSSNSLKNALTLLEQFHKFSGLKPNVEKTTCIWIGSKRFSEERLCPESKLTWSKSHFTALGINYSLNLAEIPALNYDEKMKQIQKDLQNWSKRNLTTMGRITVLKSFVIAKLVHLFIAIPSPSFEILKTLEKMFFKFVWQGKNDKVSRANMIQDYSNGGCKMLHIESFVKSLKLSWFKRLVSNRETSWQILFQQNRFMKVYNLVQFGDSFFKKTAMTMTNCFWKEVFLYIGDIFRETVVTKFDLPYEPIWYSSKIKLGGESVFYRRWYEKGIIYVYDFLSTDGKFISYDTFCRKFDFLPPVTEFFGLIKSIKKHSLNLENDLVTISLPNYPKHLDVVFNKDSNKAVYKCLISKFYKKPKSEAKWEHCLNMNPSKRWWSKVYCNSISFTADVKLRWFQFRLTHRILSCNCFLVKIGVKDSNLCTFCLEEPEDLVHLFWSCPIITSFWKAFENWIFQKTNITLNLTIFDILFAKSDVQQVFNLLICLAKNHIYQKRLKNNLPCLVALQYEIADYRNIEKFIFVKNMKIIDFDSRWNPVTALFR